MCNALGRVAAACAAFLLLQPPLARADAVTEWTLEADRLGNGAANWRSLAIMHLAMHDAVNAVEHRYRRWAQPEPDEPPAAGADPEAALDAAAAEVLGRLHPMDRPGIDEALQRALAHLPAASTRAGVTLGRAIGAAAARRHANDGFQDLRSFPSSGKAGQWRPEPPGFDAGLTNSMPPFLFASRSAFAGVPPPALGSPAALRDIDEARRMGGDSSPERTASQAAAAVFWAYQSSQRGFVLLAASLLDTETPSDGLATHARVMAQFTVAMADSAILTWTEKERFSAWRPITAIRAGGPGWAADPQWTPLIETPGHPEYPSGHASDCFVAAGLLDAVFGPGFGPVTYAARSAAAPAGPAGPEMGQHAQPQPGGLHVVERRFPSVDAAAAECAASRIWAGAHFRSAAAESRRVADEIVAAALRTLPRN